MDKPANSSKPRFNCITTFGEDEAGELFIGTVSRAARCTVYSRAMATHSIYQLHPNTYYYSDRHCNHSHANSHTDYNTYG